MTDSKLNGEQPRRMLLRSSLATFHGLVTKPALDGMSVPTLTFQPDVVDLLRRLQDFFDSNAITAHLVGGAVRDALLGRETADLDVAVSEAHITLLARALGSFLPGSVVTLDEERSIYRVMDTQGFCNIDLAPLHGATVEADAMSRDFTINALVVPLATLDVDEGTVQIDDAVGGLDDLQARKVRAVSDDVFTADSLRLLRAARLKAELGFEIDAHTVDLMHRDSHLLASVSPERVRDEFCRILDTPGVGAHVRMLDEFGLLTQIIPELEEARGVGQPKEHYWDVLQHTFEAVNAAEYVLRHSRGSSNASHRWDSSVVDRTPWDEELASYFSETVSAGRTRATLVKLAALLHDVAKPATRTIEATGRMRFIGHPELGATMTERIMTRLRFSTRETRMLSTMVDEHLRPGLITRSEQPPSRRAVHRFFRDAEGVIPDVLFLSLADYMAARGPLLEDADWRRYSGNLTMLLDAWRGGNLVPPPAKLIDGHDIMLAFNVAPSPALRQLLEAVAEGQAVGEIGTREDAIALVARLLEEHPAPTKGLP